MKRVLLFAVAILMVSPALMAKKKSPAPAPAPAPVEEIHWITSIDELQAKMAQNPKKVIIDMYTGWCGWCKKMDAATYTNPALVKYVNDTDVKQNWEKIKQQEGKKSILSGIPPSMPALIKALRLQEKTKQVGFEWENTEQVQDKVNEEIQELYEAVASGRHEDIEDEFGDVMFALINYARFVKVDPEQSLELTNRKFIRRFQRVEGMAGEQGKSLHDMDLWEMDALWNKVKEEERQQ